MKIALISASWHLDLLNVAKSSCVEELGKNKIAVDGDIDDFNVPGSLEIPLFALKLAQTRRYDGIIAFGLIVDGGIYRHEFVAQTVIDGLMRVQLDTGTPVFSCVLTPQSFHEHEEHIRFFKQHLAVKGREVAKSCVTFIDALAAIDVPKTGD
ncbi:MAG TPA: 6,7-dimethyl-8-ribityllumazine synthase [Verrucomicrobiae bacterium]|nr:6,7-dimethyl-8-ribityllumazine synthase [Verrucomicrobiae bacterium]